MVVLKIVVVDLVPGTDVTIVIGSMDDANFAVVIAASEIWLFISWPVILAALIADNCESDIAPVIWLAAREAICAACNVPVISVALTIAT